MKIFISWSGNSSRLVAEALNDWLPRVIQAVKPFLSTEIEKGAKWSSEIDKALEGTHLGIICLTSDNLDSPWIHYEVGALSKETEDSAIWTFLLNLKSTDVRQPLGKFQHTLAQREDVLRMLRSINSKLVDPLKESLLEESFNDLWPKLEKKLKPALDIIESKEKGQVKENSRILDKTDKLDEILEILRNQQRRESEKRVSTEETVRTSERRWVAIELTIDESDANQDTLEKEISQIFNPASMKISKNENDIICLIELKTALGENVIKVLLQTLRLFSGVKEFKKTLYLSETRPIL